MNALTTIAPSVSNDVFTCPSSNVRFKGLCPITHCPSNISHIKNREGGCAYIIFNKEMGKHELSFLFRKSNAEIEESVRRGNVRIRAAVFMERIVNQHLKYEGHICPKCKVARPSVGECVNIKKCNRRIRVAAVCLKKFPFKHPMLKFDPTKLFMLGKKRKTITEQLTPYLTQNSISLYDLLKVRKATFEKLEYLSL